LGEKKGKKEENLKQYSKIFQFSAMESSKWININKNVDIFNPKEKKKNLKNKGWKRRK
jgi:hypothetical protein